MFKKSILFLLAAVILALLPACGGNSSTSAPISSTTQTTSTVKPEAVPQQQDKQADSAKQGENRSPNSDFVFPAPGLRPYAVMIDNEGTRVLPQGGLAKAQVIYEMIVEGGETRLMPLFWGTDPEMLGPVRSSRHYFLDYVMENDAIYVHFGWSPMAMSDISKFHINNINGVANGGEIFHDITDDKNNWQDSYTSMDKIKEYVNKVKYRTTTEKKPVFTYSKTVVEPGSGQPAGKVSIRYSAGYTCGFTYDAPNKDYNRIRKDNPQMERTTGKQLTAENIIIENVKNNTIKGDDKGRQELSDVGSGDGWFVTCGKAVKIKWSKESRDSATKYVDEAGSDIVINPGQTWVQIVPVDGKVVIE